MNRDDLIEEIGVFYVNHSCKELNWIECMADFIIKDRQRIVEPGVNYMKIRVPNEDKDYRDKVIEKMLKLAGVKE